jgi:sugar phosphate isomerase/epimerase
MVEYFHNEYDSSLDTSFYLPLGVQAATTSTQTPNQITELGLRLNAGVKNVEIGTISPETFEQVPSQHLEEMKRLAKLTDARISLHAPIIDPAGFTQEGWSEENRMEIEERFKTVIERAHQVDPQGNIPVTIHSTIGVPAGVWRKEPGKPEKRVMYAVDQETGKLIPLKYEEEEFLTRGKVIYTPEEKLRNLNETAWNEEKLRILSYQRARQDLQDYLRKDIFQNPLYMELKIKERENQLNEQEKAMLENFERQILVTHDHMREYERKLLSSINDVYNKFSKYKYRKEELQLLDPEERRLAHSSIKEQQKIMQQVEELRKRAQKLTEEEGKILQALKQKKVSEEEAYQKLNQIRQKLLPTEDLIRTIAELPTPRLFKPAEDFAREKAAETFADLALYGYKKFGEKAPVVAIENLFPGLVMSRAETVKQAVEESRRRFAEKLMKEKKIDKDKAKKIAERLIGATWDVAHINLLRKQGYGEKEEEYKKMLKKEAEKIAPYIKHVHISDNFGHADSHLAAGMGNVPLKEQLEEIRKFQEKYGQDLMFVQEAGAFAAQFRTSPLPHELEAMNSPLYTYRTSPTWEQVHEIYGSYLVGYGEQFLPHQHYQMTGAGFSSTLPRELGGQFPGTRSRFAGTPNV